jgi:hypothetical protein
VQVVVVQGDAELARWVVADRPSLELVDGLARAQRSAARAGLRVRLEDVAPDVADLLDLTGLRDLFSIRLV